MGNMRTSMGDRSPLRFTGASGTAAAGRRLAFRCLQHEALVLAVAVEVHLHALQLIAGLPVREDLEAVFLQNLVAVFGLLIQVHAVGRAAATTAREEYPQTPVFLALGFQNLLHLLNCHIRNGYHGIPPVAILLILRPAPLKLQVDTPSANKPSH
jgi:hypothetical protein